ncbi:MAG: D-glycero-beta-D-manno-heptose 1-phosphate adenylyltransferase [Candidatus Marinimicrobia bacterium]|jgi:rfaE bifunctional protein nucleotidyltransferase chain/domain|nr:D-glycero-beta-D-manno-heptose 1-phosphate adenylyltransferase [Candidatus Neomarinimicrobiota bacterium]
MKIENKIMSMKNAKIQIKKWQNNNEKVVFTNGCFDVLHAGHIKYLFKAKSLGDHLVIGLNTDSSVRILKGKNRPLQDEQDRALILAALEAVDLVVLFDEDTPLEIITFLKPDILVKGSDYTIDNIVGAKEIVQWGGKVETIEFVNGKSTSLIIEKMEKNETN